MPGWWEPWGIVLEGPDGDKFHLSPVKGLFQGKTKFYGLVGDRDGGDTWGWIALFLSTCVQGTYEKQRGNRRDESEGKGTTHDLGHVAFNTALFAGRINAIECCSRLSFFDRRVDIYLILWLEFP